MLGPLSPRWLRSALLRWDAGWHSGQREATRGESTHSTTHAENDVDTANWRKNKSRNLQPKAQRNLRTQGCYFLIYSSIPNDS